MKGKPFALTLVLSWTLLVVRAQQDNTVCNGTAVDWYTSHVGETPCTTYQRLRRICNQSFNVGVMNPNNTFVPPDHCDDQLRDCCCNSVAFALSMLCLNCQQNVGSGSGFDAIPTAYQQYLTNSGGNMCPSVNQTLPTNVQSAVCNQQIKIEDRLYDNFWSDGSCIYNRDSINLEAASTGNNTFTHCNSTTLSSTSAAASSVTTTTSQSASGSAVAGSSGERSSSSSSVGAGAIAGIVVGVVALAVAAILAFFLMKRRKARRRYSNVTLDSPQMEESPYVVEPFAVASSSGGTGGVGGSTVSPGQSATGPSSHGGSSYVPSSHNPGTSVSSSAGLAAHGAPSAAFQREVKGGGTQMSWTPEAGQSTSAIVTPNDERHEDAGPMLGRSASGRLPPAYGEQQY